ncbi:MAG: PTS transporter subunit EIIC [Peptoniphilaceae bacterium]|nr:PTS transporter subunit EIIC [Peptoniphilaceae bacterium]MDY6018964.1 PTS transporter subunit EIIC [Anaerococcus sp.]
MDNKQRASLIIDYLGGSDNILKVVNCMTRVRVTTKDEEKVDIEKLKTVDGVMAVVESEELQIVMGPGVSAKVSKEMADLSNSKYEIEGENNNDQAETNRDKAQRLSKEKKSEVKSKQKNSKFKTFTADIAGIFVPLIPAFVGAGIIGGIGSVLQNMITAGTITSEFIISLVTVINIIKNGLFAYLNVYIGINAAKTFKANEGLGGVIGGIIYLTGMNPDSPLTNIITKDPLSAGQGGVIGVLLAVYIMSKIENKLHEVIPDSLDIIVTSTLTLLFTGLVTIFLIMPVAGFISSLLIGVTDAVINVGGAFSGFILGAFFLPLVMFGLHQILTPIHIAMIESKGATFLLPILAMAGAGQVGAAIAILVKCRKNKSLTNIVKGALPVGILGIGEPLIYAVSLPMGKTFITACIGGGIGGAVIGALGQVGASAIGPSGVALIPLIVNGRWLSYVIGLLAGYLGGFVVTYFFGIDKKFETDKGEGLEAIGDFKF